MFFFCIFKTFTVWYLAQLHGISQSCFFPDGRPILSGPLSYTITLLPVKWKVTPAASQVHTRVCSNLDLWVTDLLSTRRGCTVLLWAHRVRKCSAAVSGCFGHSYLCFYLPFNLFFNNTKTISPNY